MTAAKPKTIRLKDYRPTPYLIDTVDLSFRLDPEATRVKARMQFRPHPKVKSRGALVLDGEKLKLVSITLNGKSLSAQDYAQNDRHLIIRKPPRMRFALEIETECAPAKNTELTGLYMSNGTYCTQCEAEGFRRIMYFYDRPDVMAKYKVRIEASRALPVLLSNGNPGKSGKIAGTDLHFAQWDDPHPKPAYLFALVAGDLAKVKDNFVTLDGRKVELGIYVEQGKQDRCAWAMQSLKAAMQWDEKRFSRTYDLDVFNIVAVSDFNMGAMENKGLNIFNDKYILAKPETATDHDYELIEAIIAHEYFHNWTGNRITCRDWFQLCLKEGLTVFRDQEFTSDLRSRAVKRIDDVQDLRARQWPEDLGPLRHPPRPSQYLEINNFYTATVYDKGAEVCRMLQTLLGSKLFDRGMQLYFRRHDGEAATVEQFVKCFADVSGRDLTQFFRWYQQAGTPVVKVEESFDAKRGVMKLTLSQKTARAATGDKNKAWHIPIRIGFAGARASKVIEFTKARQLFSFTGFKEKPLTSFNRGYSAPIIVERKLTLAQKLSLLAEDTDSFNRWEMAQEVSGDLILAKYRKHDDRNWLGYVAQYVSALQSVLKDSAADDAFKARMLIFRTASENIIAIGKDVDTDRLRKSRISLFQNAAGHLDRQLRTIFEQTFDKGHYAPDTHGNARRALHNMALAMAVAGELSWADGAVQEEAKRAKHMTAEMSALGAAAQIESALRDRLLKAFYERHHKDPLIVNKWLSVQASIQGPGAAERVRKLMEHPAFVLKTPNCVYALLGAFINGNYSGFHAADGTGYRLASEAIQKLNAINPQVAARLANGFRTWRLFDAPRRNQAQKAMKEILATPQLSTDVFEIISRTLKG